MNEKLKTIAQDIEIVINSLECEDIEDAIKMLKDIQEDLIIIAVTS